MHRHTLHNRCCRAGSCSGCFCTKGGGGWVKLCGALILNILSRWNLCCTRYALSGWDSFKACLRREWTMMTRNSFLYIFKTCQVGCRAQPLHDCRAAVYVLHIYMYSSINVTGAIVILGWSCSAACHAALHSSRASRCPPLKSG